MSSNRGCLRRRTWGLIVAEPLLILLVVLELCTAHPIFLLDAPPQSWVRGTRICRCPPGSRSLPDGTRRRPVCGETVLTPARPRRFVSGHRATLDPLAPHPLLNGTGTVEVPACSVALSIGISPSVPWESRSASRRGEEEVDRESFF
jgi:hypothetical protein